MPVSLEEIVAIARVRVQAAQQETDLALLEQRAQQHRPRGFRQALLKAAAAEGFAVIGEIKRASPSRGAIRGSFPVSNLALQLGQGGASALSVLTEEQFFQGSLADLCEASAASPLPCLRKDFVVDEFQLLEARAHGADAVLLIVAVLDDAQLRSLRARAAQLELDVLCEVHDEAELARALDIGFDTIGVNSRDLRTMQVTLETAERLAPRLPPSALRVAESGIQSGADLARLHAAGYQAFLIGESLMREMVPAEALAGLLAEARRAMATAWSQGAD